MAHVIVTAVGQDRPGLVDELTGHLHTGGANIIESRMVNLRGQFAVIMLLELSDAKRLRSSLPEVGAKMGLAISVVEQSAPATPAKGIPYKLKTYSLDQPGLVHRISAVLRTHGVNIEDLTARQESAPFAGDPLFTMEMRLTVPASVQVRQLRNDLESACEKVNADLDLEPA
ncbi:MAG TPA: ACT domain-containing protein [Phycisphaerae bacterium]|nr:ACT domain-containing protein [Phycisphaerae bacterium]